jgi:hypothetical protein
MEMNEDPRETTGRSMGCSLSGSGRPDRLSHAGTAIAHGLSHALDRLQIQPKLNKICKMKQSVSIVLGSRFCRFGEPPVEGFLQENA